MNMIAQIPGLSAVLTSLQNAVNSLVSQFENYYTKTETTNLLSNKIGRKIKFY